MELIEFPPQVTGGSFDHVPDRIEDPPPEPQERSDQKVTEPAGQTAETCQTWQPADDGEGPATTGAPGTMPPVPTGEPQAVAGELPIPSFHGLVGEHPSILSISEVVRRVAPTDATVLISGESGTGKELVADAIHRLSSRGRRRFVPVHCGAIPEELLESEMFGHEKGAFTGAITTRVGRFRLADGGTIFLDEIGEMSPKLQVKLLRVLEDGRVEPLGSLTTHHVDVRIIAATNRNLQEAVAARTFREDLFYRLRVVPVEMPTLRDRRDDIPLLVKYFLQQLHAQKGLRKCLITDDTVERLMQYGWPGNVRELKNILEQMLVLGRQKGMLTAADLPAHVGAKAGLDLTRSSSMPWEFGPRGIDLYREMEAIEDRIIAQALSLSSGNKKEAARLLRVNRTTLLEKLKRKRQQDGFLGRLLNEGTIWSSVDLFGSPRSAPSVWQAGVNSFPS